MRQPWRLYTSNLFALVLGSSTAAVATESQDWGPWGMHMMWGT
jgi:hypothetical protein